VTQFLANFWKKMNDCRSNQGRAGSFFSIFPFFPFISSSFEMCSKSKSTFTLTYGDCAENHRGMQMIGKMGSVGFTHAELLLAQAWFTSRGIETTVFELDGRPVAEGAVGGGAATAVAETETEKEKAYLLVARGGVNAILAELGKTADDLFEEQAALDMDKKAFMYGRVVNKHARWNLCFGPEAQEADYEKGEGTIVPFDAVPCLEHIRQRLPVILGAAAEGLVVEGNYYYDSAKCGIGYHGDSERTKVVGVRLGKTMPICFQWYHKGEPVGENMRFELGHGDLYVMSDKAVGRDWKKRSTFTLRHAAGCDKFTKV
jgi:alkylated DNA repair dioxygenase AlkB